MFQHYALSSYALTCALLTQVCPQRALREHLLPSHRAAERAAGAPRPSPPARDSCPRKRSERGDVLRGVPLTVGGLMHPRRELGSNAMS